MTPPRCIRRVPCSMKTRMYSLFSSTVSTCRKSTARIPLAWACRNCRQVGPARRGAGSMPAACRIFHMVDGATAMPIFVSSPWMRRCPHSEFSFARRTTRRAVPGNVGGRPGLRRLLVSYSLAATLRCQASSVAGVTGKTSVQRLRGMSRARAANHTRSARSYRTRPAWRRSTAFLTMRRCQASRVAGVTMWCSRRCRGSSRVNAAITARSSQSGFGRVTRRRRTATSCRSTKISTSWRASLRARSTSQPNNRTMSR